MIRHVACALGLLLIGAFSPVARGHLENPLVRAPSLHGIPAYGSDPNETDSFLASPDGMVLAYLRQDRHAVSPGVCDGWSAVGTYDWTNGASISIRSTRPPGSCTEQLVSVTWTPQARVGSGPRLGFDAAVIDRGVAPPLPPDHDIGHFVRMISDAVTTLSPGYDPGAEEVEDQCNGNCPPPHPPPTWTASGTYTMDTEDRPIADEDGDTCCEVVGHAQVSETQTWQYYNGSFQNYNRERASCPVWGPSYERVKDCDDDAECWFSDDSIWSCASVGVHVWRSSNVDYKDLGIHDLNVYVMGYSNGRSDVYCNHDGPDLTSNTSTTKFTCTPGTGSAQYDAVLDPLLAAYNGI